MTQEAGYRNDLGTQIHDLDGHSVAVDFPHEVIDRYRTDWGRGCWSEGFRQELPVMCWNHDSNQLIGRAVRAEHLGDVSRVVSRLANFDKVPKAAEVHSLISDGIVPGFSFGFRNGTTVPHPTVQGVRRFVKAHMFEVSPVTSPAIPGTRVAGIRSLDLMARLRAEPAWRRHLTAEEIEMLATSPLSASIADEIGWRATRIERRAATRRTARAIAASRPAPAPTFTREEVCAMPDLLEQRIDRAIEKARRARRRG